MEQRKRLLTTIKRIALDVDENSVFKDAQDYGIKISRGSDLVHAERQYSYIEALSNKYGDIVSRYCAISGASSGLGGFATTITLGGVDILHMAAQLYRLNQRLAILNGFDPHNFRHQEKSGLIYLEALGIEATVNGGIRKLVTAAAKESVSKRGPAKSAAIRLIMEVVKLVGLKMSKAQAAKFVPFAGAALGGGINYIFAKRASKKMIRRYKSEYFDRLQMKAV